MTADAGSSDPVVTSAVTKIFSISWHAHSQERPEAETARQVMTYSVECEHFGAAWLVSVFNGSGDWRGGGVAEDAEDAGLAAAVVIADGLEETPGSAQF